MIGLVHRLAARPRFYDVIQSLAGVPYVRHRVKARVAALPPADVVLDIGGGTGMFRSVWTPAKNYLCLDIDDAKIRRFRQKFPRGSAVIGDATSAPVRTGVADVVACMFVGHHVSDELLSQLLAEAARMLKGNGRLVFLDPLWSPMRPLSRLIWRYDRGGHPRTGERLRQAIEVDYEILDWQRFAVFHMYVLCVAAKRAKRAAGASNSFG